MAHDAASGTGGEPTANGRAAQETVRALPMFQLPLLPAICTALWLAFAAFEAGLLRKHKRDPLQSGTSRDLTFDMSGDRKPAQPAGGRPLDGGVRCHVA